MAVAAPVRAAGYFALSYRRTWRASIMTTIGNPVLYLLAMGIGLGHFVDKGGGRSPLGGVSYLDFVAPGLAVAGAVQTAASEATFPIMGAIKWQKTYHAMLVTPLTVMDVMAGHLLWIAARVAMSVASFMVVMAAFGTLHSWQSAAILPAGILTGAAFITPLAAFSVLQTNDGVFSLIFRLAIVPLFLFSAVFFPLSQLPVGLRVVAYATPMWHGVDLCRSLALGRASGGGLAVHLGYLMAVTVAGTVAGRATYLRRLRV